MKFNKINKFVVIGVIAMGLLLAPIFCSLADDSAQSDYGLGETASRAYDQPIGDLESDPTKISGVIVGIVLAALGIMFMIQIIIGGISWMTASGNEEKITKAKKTIIHSALGLIIVIGAFALTNYILKGLFSAVFK